MPPQKRRLRSSAVRIGVVGTLSLTLVACGSSSTRAWCVDRQGGGGFFVGAKGGYLVVPGSKCAGDGSLRPYFWYYGGQGYSSGWHDHVPHGSSARPHGPQIHRRGVGAASVPF